MPVNLFKKFQFTHRSDVADVPPNYGKSGTIFLRLFHSQTEDLYHSLNKLWRCPWFACNTCIGLI